MLNVFKFIGRQLFKKKPKYLLTAGVFLFLFIFAGTSEKASVSAHLYAGLSVLDHQLPVPKAKLACDKVGNPEFHSLRPYQAAPCGDSDKTLFCFNNYQLMETVSTTWSLACVDYGAYYSCPPDPGDEEIEKVYTIDGEYARFPIMGNTENVRNSQTK